MTTAMKIDATYASFRLRVSGNATVIELFLPSGMRPENRSFSSYDLALPIEPGERALHREEPRAQEGQREAQNK